MPSLLDIALVKVGKQSAADAQKALTTYSKNLYRPPLSMKNKLKTQINIGDESHMSKFIKPPESDGIFASWCKNLNRKPAEDLFEHQPLNQVKTNNNKAEIRQLELEIKHKNWLQEVKERMAKLGFDA